jgi:hypothetical protein
LSRLQCTAGLIKHKENSEQKTIIFGLCEMIIHLSSVST